MFHSTFDRAMFLILVVLAGVALGPTWWIGLLVGLAIGFGVIAWNPEMPKR